MNEMDFIVDCIGCDSFRVSASDSDHDGSRLFYICECCENSLIKEIC